MVDNACSTDLESQKIANLVDVLALQYRNADIKACNSAEKMDDLSGNRFENSKDGVTTAQAVLSPSLEPSV